MHYAQTPYALTRSPVNYCLKRPDPGLFLQTMQKLPAAFAIFTSKTFTIKTPFDVVR
jgi:hypothetical protein